MFGLDHQVSMYCRHVLCLVQIIKYPCTHHHVLCLVYQVSMYPFTMFRSSSIHVTVTMYYVWSRSSSIHVLSPCTMFGLDHQVSTYYVVTYLVTYLLDCKKKAGFYINRKINQGPKELHPKGARSEWVHADQ
jgi:hypothetical protein